MSKHYSIHDSRGVRLGMVYFIDDIQELEGGKKGLVQKDIAGYVAILENVKLEAA